jgi:hypothetical protein
MPHLLGWFKGKGKALQKPIGPAIRKAKDSGWVGTLLHLLAVAAALAVLAYLNQFPAVYLKIPRYRLLSRSWLPILFLLVYSLGWLSYWLWKLLVAEDDGRRFPDIDEAWRQAKDALRQAGLSLTDLPLFLVLGQPEDDEKALFQASGLPWEVKQAPANADAPVHVYASRESAFVTCAGASVLGRHALELAGKLLDKGGAAPGQPGGEEDEIVTRTLSPGANGVLVPQGPFADMARVLQQADREGRPLSKAEKRELRCLYRQNQPRRPLLRDPDVLNLQAARLAYLCRLLVRDRQPFCAANGVLLLLPFAGTDSDQDAVSTGDALQRDLAATREGLKVECPHVALVCDMETAPGFGEFIQRFSPRERLQRLGQSCPLVPDLAGNGRGPSAQEGAADVLGSLAQWVCHSVMPRWVYHKFQLERPDTADRGELVRGNARLFLLADELQGRSRRLATVLARGLAGRASPTTPLLFGGCYLAGTGSDAEREQAFVRGVLDRLMDGQSCVYWSEQTLAEEAQYLRWLTLGWTILGLFVLVCLALAGYALFGR